MAPLGPGPGDGDDARGAGPGWRDMVGLALCVPALWLVWAAVAVAS